MTETGWITIVTLVTTSIGSMFSAWIALQNNKLNKKVESLESNLTANTQVITGQVSAIAATTNKNTRLAQDTKNQVAENSERMNGRMTELLEEAKKSAYQAGILAGQEEARAIAKELLIEKEVIRERIKGEETDFF